MSIIAVIPARSGSKRLPRKNVKPLCGKPLIAWSIMSAIEASCFSRVIVSTDSDEIAKLALASGAEVPWLRSVKNSSDISVATDVVLEVLGQIKRSDDEVPSAIMLLQPTSPFRSTTTIRRALELYTDSNNESVVSVSPVKNHPWWCKTISAEGELLSFIQSAPTNCRSQDLPPAYALNGAIYLASVATLYERKSFYSERTRALIIESPEEALDIDTPFDWLIAEAICRDHQADIL